MSKQHSERTRQVPAPLVPVSETADLKQTLAQVDDFLATLSHELRQPLAAALAAVEIQKHSPGVDRQEKARHVIEQQLRYIARLVGDLSEVSRISRGAIELRRERIELGSVVREAIVMCEPMFDERHQQVTLILAREPAYVYGDAVRLKQVVSNLLKNSASYTPPGGAIEVRLEVTAEHARVLVKDNGAGIARDVIGQIFELFHRGVAGGDGLSAGIGLAVVRRLVELHGGSVSAASDGPGRGSEFTVVLPRDTSN